MEAATLDQPPVVPTLALPWQMKASDISPIQGVVQSVGVPSVETAQVVAAQVVAGMTEMQIQLHHLSGTLFGHSHCQEPGPVFVLEGLLNWPAIIEAVGLVGLGGAEPGQD